MASETLHPSEDSVVGLRDEAYAWLYEVEPVVIASTRIHDVAKATLPDGRSQLSMSGVVQPVDQISIET